MWQNIDNFYITDVQPKILEKCEEVHTLLQKSCRSSDRTIAVTRRALEKSLNFGIFETVTDKLVGYARIVTDYATMYYLCDVCIDEAYRGLGLSEALIQWICIDEDKLSGLDGYMNPIEAQVLYENGFLKL